MAAQNVCFFNKYGFCKYSERCRKYHENEICEKFDCEIRECHLRHPKVCKFFRDMGFCKFSEWCKFSHKVCKNNTLEKDELKNLKEKIQTMENEMKKKSDIVEKLENEIKDINRKNLEKDQTISKINKKLNVLKEKVTLMFNLEDKYDTLEKKVEKLSTEIVKENKDSSETSSKLFDETKCSLCEFKAKNKFGLKIHFHKKHSTAKFKCFTCDFTCESHDELIPHNDKYYYSHRQVLNKNYEKHILDEIQQLDEDGFLFHRTLNW